MVKPNHQEPLRIPASKARFEPADILNRIAFSGEHVIIQRHEKDLTAVIPIQDYELLKSSTVRTLDEQASFRLAAIVEFSNDAIIGKTLNGIITNWNPAAERLYGYLASEVNGQPISMLIPSDRHNEVPEIMQKIIQGERVEHYETVRICKDGQLKDISLTVSPIKDQDGKIIGASTIARDITERKRAEAELKTSQEQLRALSARLQILQEEERQKISHEIQDEFGQALTALKLDLAWINRHLPTNQETLQNKMTAMNHLLDTTLQSMRKVSTQLRPRLLEDLGLIPAIEEEINQFQKRTGILCTLTVNSEDINLGINYAISIFRILQDALEYISQIASKVSINIQIDKLNRIFLLEIIDGSHPDHNQPNKELKSIHLVSLQERVLLLGGKIEVSNKNGNGIALTITIALQQETSTNESQEMVNNQLAEIANKSLPQSYTKSKNISKTRILIADSHAIIREGLKQILTEVPDMSVSGEASNAKEVLEKIRSEQWDVILLDISLPGKNGLDLLKQIKTENSQIPILILSAETEEQYAIRVLKAGASGYLTKETAPDELIQAVQKVARGGQYVSDAIAEKLLFELRIDSGQPLHKNLSDREFQVLCLIATGKNLTDIAQELKLSIKTVSTYRTKLLQKMQMKNNVELVHYAIENNLKMGN